MEIFLRNIAPNENGNSTGERELRHLDKAHGRHQPLHDHCYLWKGRTLEIHLDIKERLEKNLRKEKYVEVIKTCDGHMTNLTVTF